MTAAVRALFSLRYVTLRFLNNHFQSQVCSGLLWLYDLSADVESIHPRRRLKKQSFDSMRLFKRPTPSPVPPPKATLRHDITDPPKYPIIETPNDGYTVEVGKTISKKSEDWLDLGELLHMRSSYQCTGMRKTQCSLLQNSYRSELSLPKVVEHAIIAAYDFYKIRPTYAHDQSLNNPVRAFLLAHPCGYVIGRVELFESTSSGDVLIIRNISSSVRLRYRMYDSELRAAIGNLRQIAIKNGTHVFLYAKARLYGATTCIKAESAIFSASHKLSAIEALFHE